MNLNQITLPVKNMEQAVSFYLQLGFIQVVGTPHYVRFECPEGGATFSLSLDSREYRNGAVIYFEHKELESWVDELKGKGVVFTQDVREESWLWKEAVLYDPSGNKIKLY